MKIKIAIADTNETYARRLFEALQRQENLSLSVFTDKKRMESDLSSTRYDIILFDYSMYSGDGIFKNAKLSVLLYDEEAEQPYIGTGKYKVVKKYQRGSSIYKEVIGLYSEFVSDSVFFGRSGEQCRVLCVYSPVGGVGKTTVSMAIANTIANMGRNVMYLNFEPIPAYGSFMPLKGEKGMGALLAAIDGNGSFSLKLESLMKKTPQGIIYFEKFENLLDIYELTAEDVEKLIRMISETVKADFIIVDMGTQYDAVNRSIMDISDKIVFVERNDSITAKAGETIWVELRFDGKNISLLSAGVNDIAPSAGAFEESEAVSGGFIGLLCSKGMILFILSAAVVICIISKKAKRN